MKIPAPRSSSDAAIAISAFFKASSPLPYTTIPQNFGLKRFGLKMSRPDRGPCMEYVGAGRPCRRAIRNTRRNSANGSSMAGNAVRIHRTRVRTRTSGIFFARRSSATENNRRRSARSAGASEEATRTAHAYPGFPAQAHFGGGYSDRRRSRRSSVADAALIATQLRRCERVDGFGLRGDCAAEVAGLRGVEPPTTWFVARCSIQLSYRPAETTNACPLDYDTLPATSTAPRKSNSPIQQ